jgi:hypothetical protein
MIENIIKYSEFIGMTRMIAYRSEGLSVIKIGFKIPRLPMPFPILEVF